VYIYIEVDIGPVGCSNVLHVFVYTIVTALCVNNFAGIDVIRFLPFFRITRNYYFNWKQRKQKY